MSQSPLPQNSDNALLNNRKHLSDRASIQAIKKFAHEQDHKIYNRNRTFIRARLTLNFMVFGSLTLYVFYQFTIGYWRKIYPGNFFLNIFEIPQGSIRESMVPELYLKQKQHLALDVKLKQSKQMLDLLKSKEQSLDQ